MPLMRTDEAAAGVDDFQMTPIFEAGRVGRIRIASEMDLPQANN